MRTSEVLHSSPVKVMEEKARTLEEGEFGAKDVWDTVPERSYGVFPLKPQFYKDHMITY